MQFAPSTPVNAQFDPSKLADIHLPDPISFWPIAPGWWFLLMLIIVLLILLIIKLFTRKQSPKYKQASLKSLAIKELKAIKKHYKHDQDPIETIKQMSIFLRRYALSVKQRTAVAALTDEQWLKVLDEISQSSLYSERFSSLLTQAPYQAPHTIDGDLVLELIDNTLELVKTYTSPTSDSSASDSSESKESANV